MKTQKLMFPSALLSIILVGCNTNKIEETKRPNILFAIADDASFPHMGAYGSDLVKTPAFDRVAKQGVLFTNAYTPNAKCAPSRACILTGRNSWQLEEACNHMPYFPVKFKTFPEVLTENGYYVGYTGKGWAPGIALTKEGGMRDLLVKPYNHFSTNPPTKGISNCDYAANFEAFLDENTKENPFFFWYGGFEPHRVYEYGSGIKNGKKMSELYDVFTFWPDVDSVRTDLLDYAFELEYFDKQLQKMLITLEERELLDNTIVVVTADNGMPFPRIKGQEYEMSNHLPLAIMWPKGIKHKGRIVEDFVSFIDFAPTILELIGVKQEKTGMQPITGKSITDIFLSDLSGIINDSRDHILIGKERHDIGRPNNVGYPIRGIVKGQYLYLHNFKPDRWPVCNPETGYLNCDGSPTKTVCLNTRNTDKNWIWELNFGFRPEEELYEIKSDPLCMTNLAEQQKYLSIKNELKKQLMDELKEQQDPRILGNGDIFDQYGIYPPEFENYYDKYMKGEAKKVNWANESDYR